LEEKRSGQNWRNKEKLRQDKLHRSVFNLSLKWNRRFIRWYLTVDEQDARPKFKEATGTKPFPRLASPKPRHEDRVATFDEMG